MEQIYTTVEDKQIHLFRRPHTLTISLDGSVLGDACDCLLGLLGLSDEEHAHVNIGVPPPALPHHHLNLLSTLLGTSSSDNQMRDYVRERQRPL
jgi:hypothetical protein